MIHCVYLIYCHVLGFEAISTKIGKYTNSG